MRGPAGALIAALAVASLAAKPAAAASLDGRYSNVCMSRETGDQGGMELVLQGAAVTLKICEGGCWAAPVRAVSIKGVALSFIADDQSFDADGRLVETHPMRFDGVLRGATLRLGSLGNWDHQTLRRQRPDPAGAAPDGPSAWPTPIRVCR